VTVKRNRVIAAAVLTILGSLGIASARADQAYEFDLPEQSLADSLRQIAQRATMNILFDASSVERFRAPPIKGTMSPHEALQRVLAGTRFVIEEMNSHSVLVGTPDTGHEMQATSWGGELRLAQATDAPAPAEPVRAEESTALAEVTVTAQRRAENSQTVPIAISTVSAEDAKMRGAVSIETLTTTVPSLMTTGSSGTSIYIRGVGNTSASPNNESSAATYIDGVYQPSIFGLIGFPFNNIERVEVLKGPQGTLFGRNSTAGVVQIITPDPRHDAGGRISVGYANYSAVSSDAYLTSGITDDLAADFAVVYENQGEGWGHNVDTGTEIYRRGNLATRSKWLYTPGESTDVRLALDYERFWYTSGTQLAPGSFATDRVTTYPGRYNAYGDINRNTHEQYGASVRIDHDFGVLHGTSITGYRDVKARIELDNDRMSAPLFHVDSLNDSDYVSQEFQISNRDPGRVTWLGGVFLYGNTVRGTDPRTETGTSVRPNRYRDIFGRQRTRSYSVFGQATAELFADTKLTLGLRYTDEKLKADGRFQDRAGAVINGPFDDEVSYQPWTWRVALDHQFTRDVLGYVSYNRGFKSGGYNLNTPGTVPFFPETLDAYETGLKSEFLNHRVRLNLAVFYYDYKNMQVAIVPGGAGQIFTNAAAARNYGLDASLDFAASEHVTLSMGVGLLDAQYEDYPNAQGFRITGTSFILANAKGNDLPFSPPYSGYVSGKYRLPTSVGEFRGTVSASYSDKAYITADNSFFLPSQLQLSSSVEWWSQAAKPIGVRLWGRNLTNTYFYTNRIESTGGWYQIAAAPRTFGLTVIKDF
jgi:iron complex outermembrane receptor protein